MVNDKEFKIICKWFDENKKEILKKASAPSFISVSDQVYNFICNNSKYFTTKNLECDTLARILTWSI